MHRGMRILFVARSSSARAVWRRGIYWQHAREGHIQGDAGGHAGKKAFTVLNSKLHFPCPCSAPHTRTTLLYRHRGSAALALPDAAGVVLGPRDDGVAFVVEGAREDLVDVSFQNL